VNINPAYQATELEYCLRKVSDRFFLLINVHCMNINAILTHCIPESE